MQSAKAHAPELRGQIDFERAIGVFDLLVAALRAIGGGLGRGHRRRKSVAQLNALGNHMLADIGIDQAKLTCATYSDPPPEN